MYTLFIFLRRLRKFSHLLRLLKFPRLLDPGGNLYLPDY